MKTMAPLDKAHSSLRQNIQKLKGETRKKAKKKIGIQIRGFGKARKR